MWTSDVEFGGVADIESRPPPRPARPLPVPQTMPVLADPGYHDNRIHNALQRALRGLAAAASHYSPNAGLSSNTPHDVSHRSIRNLRTPEPSRRNRRDEL